MAHEGAGVRLILIHFFLDLLQPRERRDHGPPINNICQQIVKEETLDITGDQTMTLSDISQEKETGTSVMKVT